MRILCELSFCMMPYAVTVLQTSVCLLSLVDNKLDTRTLLTFALNLHVLILTLLIASRILMLFFYIL